MAGRSDRLLDALVADAEALAGELAALGEPGVTETVERVRGQISRVSGSATARRAAIGSLVCELVVVARQHGVAVGHAPFAAGVRHLAEELRRRHPGQTIEVRVPPLTAVQIGSASGGPTHTRGTPPNVVEMDAETWFDLATGALTWDAATASQRVRSSGAHAGELAEMLPVLRSGAASS